MEFLFAKIKREFHRAGSEFRIERGTNQRLLRGGGMVVLHRAEAADGNAARVANAAGAGAGSRTGPKKTPSGETMATLQEIDQPAASRRGARCR